MNSSLAHVVKQLPFLSYLVGFKSVSACQSALDTMTNTAQEATVSSIGKNETDDDISAQNIYYHTRVSYVQNTHLHQLSDKYIQRKQIVCSDQLGAKFCLHR